MPLKRSKKYVLVGASLLILGILLHAAILPAVIRSQIKKKIALKKGWIMRDIWGKFPFPIEFRFYMFNVTNPYDIERGEKPIVRQVGPFVYDEWQEKVEQIDNEEEDTVSYLSKSTYYFNKEKSNGLSDEDEITFPHFFVFALINTVREEKPGALSILSKAIDSLLKKPDSLFVRVKVKDVLFDGLAIDCNVKDFAATAVCGQLEIHYKSMQLQLVGKNLYAASIMGPSNATGSKERTRVYRGLKDIMDVGRVVEYNGRPNISVWRDERCDGFNGATDGTVFHPYFDKRGRDDLVAFNPKLCRSISCHFDSKTTFAGLELLRYTADLGIDGQGNPRHKCYCQSPNKCPKKGAFNIYKCTKAPIIVTNPHFFLADPYYTGLIEGMKPDKEKHMIIIDLDPFTGIPVTAHTRAQLNMFINKIDKVKQMNGYPEAALLPLLWMDEIVILPEYLVKQIKFGHRMLLVGRVLKYLLMAVGSIVCLYAAILRFKDLWRGQAQEHVVANGTPTVEGKQDIRTIAGSVLPVSLD